MTNIMRKLYETNNKDLHLLQFIYYKFFLENIKIIL